MTENNKTVREIDRETLEHLDPARKAFAEELIRSGEWRLKPDKKGGEDNDN